jgi:phosphoserine phosphatase
MKKLLLACAAFITAAAHASDPLPSWNEGKTKDAVISFVTKTTKEGSADFVPVAERIAVFDNDGTLWCEQPFYFQGFYVFERIKELSAQHPEWKTQEPYASILRSDYDAVLSSGEKGIFELMTTSHSGLTTEEFEKSVGAWFASAKHPTTGKPFAKMVYQPMLEVLNYLRANGYKPYIVSGGGIEFMRVWAERVYGIPPEQVIGSTGGLKFEIRNGTPVIHKLKEMVFLNDNDGKVIGIQRHIGRRPVMAFGNSDGDLEMIQWTGAGTGPRFCLYVHHTDAEREWAYDRTSKIGRLNKGLDEAAAKGWTVMDMKRDWNTIFPK